MDGQLQEARQKDCVDNSVAKLLGSVAVNNGNGYGCTMALLPVLVVVVDDTTVDVDSKTPHREFVVVVAAASAVAFVGARDVPVPTVLAVFFAVLDALSVLLAVATRAVSGVLLPTFFVAPLLSFVVLVAVFLVLPREDAVVRHLVLVVFVVFHPRFFAIVLALVSVFRELFVPCAIVSFVVPRFGRA